ncbi:DUF475 domain-containing protein [Sphingobacteriales bacterium UPWRP_1]|nr:hypothetical protein B6N25_04065 [Sphingobacteriales bacterium TSM_CSS]PSJ76703.1 DUF475 domain-containing protein [Sphingobacteriales bacterium UPWRP_1]
MITILQEIFKDTGLVVIVNLVVMESLLSIDNAAVLATMVLRLPPEQRGKALRYGLLIGYVLRGLCLLFASVLMKILWLKALGGAYLFYLALHYFKNRFFPPPPHDYHLGQTPPQQQGNVLYRFVVNKMGFFWATVIQVELMDLTFAIDNVFVAVALSDNIYVIWAGVFIGILAMRFVAQAFVKLMQRFRFLEMAAFIVIALLGAKLITDAGCDYGAHLSFCRAIDSHAADFYFSMATLAIFAIPILVSVLLKRR